MIHLRGSERFGLDLRGERRPRKKRKGYQAGADYTGSSSGGAKVSCAYIRKPGPGIPLPGCSAFEMFVTSPWTMGSDVIGVADPIEPYVRRAAEAALPSVPESAGHRSETRSRSPAE